jgi:hypothetical protein
LTRLTKRLRFFGKFFAKFIVAAAVCVFLWKGAGLAGAYSYAVLVLVTVLSPLLTGFHVVLGTGAHGLTAFFEAGTTRIEVPFVLHEALAGVIPFVGLMCASGGQSIREALSRTAIGLGVLYLCHVVVITLSPLLVTDHAWWITRIIDVTFGFYAVAGFVGLPFFLWMVLTRPWETAAGVEAARAPEPSVVAVSAPPAKAFPGKRKR